MASSLKLIGRLLNKRNLVQIAYFSMGSSTSSFKNLPIVTSQPDYPKKFNKEELKNKLSQLQYHVTQEKGTERPFSGEYEHMYEKDPGIFNCVVCDQKIFETKAKFESGSGWPSFYDVINQDRVKLIEDVSYGMSRIEVTCSGCGAHLGHVFNDGPIPTGLRYCINSASISFEKNKK